MVHRQRDADTRTTLGLTSLSRGYGRTRLARADARSGEPRVLGGGDHYRIGARIHRGLVVGHEPAHHIGRRAVLRADLDDLRVLIMPFGSRALDHQEVAHLRVRLVVKSAEHRALRTEDRGERHPRLRHRRGGSAAVADRFQGLQPQSVGNEGPDGPDLRRGQVRSAAGDVGRDHREVEELEHSESLDVGMDSFDDADDGAYDPTEFIDEDDEF